MNPEPFHTARRIYCANCKEVKPRESPKTTRLPNHTRELLLDPFCSADCAKRFHGVAQRRGEMAA